MATTEEEARGTATEAGAIHGGRHVARALKSRGVTHLFTLSGGHLFSIYDGCKAEGIEVIDTRHEQSAAWAAEGFAKATRGVGVCALTAGPGVTNGMSAMAGALQNRSPLVVLGGRAPEMRWGSGSLQEIDHVPFVAPVTKSAETVKDPAEIAAVTAAALDRALEQPSGPVFVDYPLDVVFSEAEAEVPPAPERAHGEPAEGAEEAGELLAKAERPAIMAGTGLYWAHGEEALRGLAAALEIPVFLNGMGRGCVPADHELYFSRARGRGLKEADVALVVGVPLDFRLGFGGSFGEETKVIYLDVEPNKLHRNRQPDLELTGDIAATLGALHAAAVAAGGGAGHTEPWLKALRETEAEKREAEAGGARRRPRPAPPDAHLQGAQGGPRPRRDRHRRRRRLRLLRGPRDRHLRARHLDGPGPLRLPGRRRGPGDRRQARPPRPARSASSWATAPSASRGLELDTMARHDIAVVGIIGNNGIWALEHHPMKFLYGYSLAAELRQGTRYDEVAGALGCEAELVERPDQLRPALDRAFSSGRPTLVNALTDPEVVYPRKSVLA